MPNQPFLSDWVRETSTVEGTGDITLLGPVATFRAFASLYATGDVFYYTVKHRTALEAESGIGQLTAGGTIARNTVLESTNGNAAVMFSPGTKDVFIAPISTMFPTLADNEIWQGVSGSVPIATNSPTLDSLNLNGDLSVANGANIDGTTNVIDLNVDQSLAVQGQITVLPGNLANPGYAFDSPGNNTGMMYWAAAPGFMLVSDGNPILSGKSATAWADNLLNCVYVQLGIGPTNVNAILCREGAALLNRFAVLSTTCQIARYSPTAIPTPLSPNPVLEVLASGSTAPLVVLRPIAGQTATLLDCIDGTAGTSLLSVQSGGELRGHAVNGNIKLQDGIAGVGILDANNLTTGVWADSITGTTRVRWGSTSPASASNVMFCTTGGNQMARFAVSATSMQFSGRLGSQIPAPLTNSVVEITGGSASILLGLRTGASSTGNLLNTYDSANVVMSSIGPTGRFLAPDGAVNTPGISFSANTGVGLNHPASTNQLQVCASSLELALFQNGSPQTQITALTAAVIPLRLRGFASQTANLLDFQDSTPTTLSAINSTGRFLAPDGTNSLPGYSFLNSTNTGIYKSGNALGAVVNATQLFFIGTSIGAQFICPAANVRAMMIKAAASQSANIFEILDSSSNVLTKITALGSAVLAGAALATSATDGFTYLPSCAGKPIGTPTAQTGTVPIVVDSTGNQNFIYSGGKWVCVGPNINIVTFGLGIGTPITVGTNKTNEITLPYPGEIVRVRARAKTGPTGADLIFDINLNGTTIWATQANRLKITAGGTTGSQTTFDTTTFADGDVVTIDVDQVGSTVAGQDITVQLEVRKTG